MGKVDQHELDKRDPRNLTKSELRKTILALRKELSGEDVHLASAAICRRFLDLPVARRAGTIMAYLPFRNEADPTDIITHFLQLGKRIAVPVTFKEEGRLEASALSDIAADLITGAYGILEPRPERLRIIPPHEVDLVIVPGVAFDPTGGRIGYGGGYYDRFLPRLRTCPPVILVALAYELQIVPHIATEEHDYRVDVIVTERRSIDCRVTI